MKTETKIYDRVVSELDYCMSKEFIQSKEELQKEISSTLMKVILLVEKQLNQEETRK